jgi:chorismate mutase
MRLCDEDRLSDRHKEASMGSTNGQQSEQVEVDWQKPLHCRGIRGATTVEEDTPEAILAATRELLMGMIKLNGIKPEDVGSVIFTTTVDLNAQYPAVAARQLGWHEVPLLCAHEMNVPNSLQKCLRILVMWNTTKTQQEIRHVYLKDAATLRPDRSIEMKELISEIAEELEKITLENTQ